ncbi:MAG TPA: hypothetical protein VG318_16445 [Actinomycetota bacterium]|nr:hypothetical protein [Actinomycetota bacterium]
MRKGIALLVAAGLSLGLAGSAGAGAPVAVWEDAADDVAVNGNLVAGAGAAGVDLLKGEIARVGKDIEFKVTHASMPAPGSLPEAARFMWHFSVDGEQYRMTVKSVDIGKPDAIAQNGTERVGKVDTAGHFRVEQCASDTTIPVTLNNCTAIAYYTGAFDVAGGTFAFEVPMADLKAKPGSLIAGGTSGAAASGCQICWALHKAERSLTATTILDAAAQATTYKVPKK